ncbi:MAG: hypothetical protein PHV07_05155 [Oscillospiraceae bacterium]|nr:hypothetical protein [Tissierellia bacterium]MDD4699634.1 hypothetical protein [Oscillospiraceae bacterium]
MLRGVNKQIIEVNNTGNRYFDKALLFVNPQYADISRHKLDIEANMYIDSLENSAKGNDGGYLKQNKKKGIIRTGLLFSISAILLFIMIYVIFL